MHVWRSLARCIISSHSVPPPSHTMTNSPQQLLTFFSTLSAWLMRKPTGLLTLMAARYVLTNLGDGKRKGGSVEQNRWWDSCLA